MTFRHFKSLQLSRWLFAVSASILIHYLVMHFVNTQTIGIARTKTSKITVLNQNTARVQDTRGKHKKIYKKNVSSAKTETDNNNINSGLVFPTAGDVFFASNELDISPTLETDLALETLANNLTSHTKITLTIFLDEFGRATNIQIENDDPDPPNMQFLLMPLFEAKFTPGVKNGQPVKSVVRYLFEVQIPEQ
jgi:hypothetical protein